MLPINQHMLLWFVDFSQSKLGLYFSHRSSDLNQNLRYTETVASQRRLYLQLQNIVSSWCLHKHIWLHY